MFYSPERKFDIDTERYKFDLVPTANDHLLDERLDRVVEELTRDYLQPSSLADFCHEVVQTANLPADRVLHIGGSTGRVSFDLTKYFEEVCTV